MDNGAAIQVFRKQSEATRNFQVSSVSLVVNSKNDLKISLEGKEGKGRGFKYVRVFTTKNAGCFFCS